MNCTDLYKESDIADDQYLIYIWLSLVAQAKFLSFFLMKQAAMVANSSIRTKPRIIPPIIHPIPRRDD